MAQTEPEPFSLETLHRCFKECLKDDGHLDMKNYILGYEELYKFLHLLGTVFGWVGSDVKAKLDILSSHKNSDVGHHYSTVESMLEYETKENLIKHKAKDSTTGSRNLLRLHRALQYIISFLESLPDMDHADKCCHVSQNAYKKTLAKYHPWVVQKGALMAMHMLPTKEGLIHKLCGDSEEEYKEACRILPEAVASMQQIYDKTETLYADRKLLDLP